MKAIPLNLLTLYADLMQQVDLRDTRPGSISTKTVDGKRYLYAVEKDGRVRTQRFLGPADSASAQAEAKRVRHAELRAKGRRSTVSALKQARIPAPTLELGRVLETVSNAGLFDMGIVLVGTGAFRLYPCVVGAYLSSVAVATNDADLSVASFTARENTDLAAVLTRADPTFGPHWSAEDRLPKVFKAASGFTVEIVTRYGKGRRSPVEIERLGCAATALSFQEYLVEDAFEVVALYGAGVLVRVPAPIRYAVHKLICAQRRKPLDPKRSKDLTQARELIDIFLETDEASLQDALDEARDRGRAWKTAINASLREIGREARQGRLPLPASKR